MESRYCVINKYSGYCRVFVRKRRSSLFVVLTLSEFVTETSRGSFLLTMRKTRNCYELLLLYHSFRVLVLV